MTVAAVAATEAGGWRRRGRLWARLGLRARVTFLFGAGALVLSAVMGGLSYWTARHFLLTERVSADLRQTYASATLVRSDLRLGNSNLDGVVSQVNAGQATDSVLYYRGKPYASSLSLNERALPPSLVAMVRSGTPAVQNFMLRGSPRIAVGVPIPSVNAFYFEVFDIGDLAHTLRVLALALAA